MSASLVMAHGAGSHAGFLVRAFPDDRTGLRLRAVDDRTGRIDRIMNALAAEAVDHTVVLGGVSLGAHAAATLLARADLPRQIVAGVLVMPAWTGAPDRVAHLTAAAADALAVLGPDGVLAELDSQDWVTGELADAWAQRDPAELVSELSQTAQQAAPDRGTLRRIPVPCVVVALADDPLHPESVARQWAELIPRSQLVVIGRNQPSVDLACFGDTVAGALTDLGVLG